MLGGRSEVFLMIYTCSSFGLGHWLVCCQSQLLVWTAFFLQGSLLMMGALVLSRVLSTRLTWCDQSQCVVVHFPMSCKSKQGNVSWSTLSCDVSLSIHYSVWPCKPSKDMTRRVLRNMSRWGETELMRMADELMWLHCSACWLLQSVPGLWLTQSCLVLLASSLSLLVITNDLAQARAC